MFFRKTTAVASVIAPLFLSACDQPLSAETTDSVRQAAAAETLHGRMSELRDGKGLFGVFDSTKQYFIATKKSDAENNCAKFDVITFSAAPTKWNASAAIVKNQQNIQICLDPK